MQCLLQTTFHYPNFPRFGKGLSRNLNSYGFSFPPPSEPTIPDTNTVSAGGDRIFSPHQSQGMPVLSIGRQYSKSPNASPGFCERMQHMVRETKYRIHAGDSALIQDWAAGPGSDSLSMPSESEDISTRHENNAVEPELLRITEPPSYRAASPDQEIEFEVSVGGPSPWWPEDTSTPLSPQRLVFLHTFTSLKLKCSLTSSTGRLQVCFLKIDDKWVLPREFRTWTLIREIRWSAMKSVMTTR